MELLQRSEDGHGLMLKTNAEPVQQVCDPADPFARPDGIGYPVDAEVGGSEICITAEHGIMKQVRGAVETQLAVGEKGVNKFPIDSASRVVQDLLDFQLVFFHGRLQTREGHLCQMNRGALLSVMIWYSVIGGPAIRRNNCSLNGAWIDGFGQGSEAEQAPY